MGLVFMAFWMDRIFGSWWKLGQLGGIGWISVMEFPGRKELALRNVLTSWRGIFREPLYTVFFTWVVWVIDGKIQTQIDSFYCNS